MPVIRCNIIAELLMLITNKHQFTDKNITSISKCVMVHLYKQIINPSNLIINKIYQMLFHTKTENYIFASAYGFDVPVH